MQCFIKRCVCASLCMFCILCMLLLSLPVPRAEAEARTVSSADALAVALYERETTIEVQAAPVDNMLSEVLCVYPLLGFIFKGYEGAIHGDTISMTMEYRDDAFLPVLSVDTVEAFEAVVTEAAIASSEELHIMMPDSMRNTDFGSVFDHVFSSSVLARTMLSAFSWEIWSNSYTEMLYMSLTIQYSVEHDKLIRYKQRAEEEAIRLAGSLFYEGAEDVVMALLAHDALVNRCTYSKEGYREENHSAYGALCNRSAVCEGYAEAYQLLMDIAGVDCLYAEGVAGEPHAWNILFIDGAYYHVDTTWDDPVGDDGIDRLTHDYFLLSDTQLAQTHTWNRDAYPVANATLWDAPSAKEQLAQSGGNHRFTVEYTPKCDDGSLQAYEQQMADLLHRQKPPSTSAQTTTEHEIIQSTTGTEQDTSSADTAIETTTSHGYSVSSTEETTYATTNTTAAEQHRGVSKGALYLVWGILIVFVLGILYAKYIH